MIVWEFAQMILATGYYWLQLTPEERQHLVHVSGDVVVFLCEQAWATIAEVKARRPFASFREATGDMKFDHLEDFPP